MSIIKVDFPKKKKEQKVMEFLEQELEIMKQKNINPDYCIVFTAHEDDEEDSYYSTYGYNKMSISQLKYFADLLYNMIERDTEE